MNTAVRCGLLCFSVFLASAAGPALSAEEPIGVWFTVPEKNGEHGTFSQPEDELVALVDSAQSAIDGAFFEIGSKRVADAFIRAHKRGVKVRLVTDDSNLDKPSCKKVQAAGIPVVDDGKKGLMHDKFAIVDGHVVWTGHTTSPTTARTVTTITR